MTIIPDPIENYVGRTWTSASSKDDQMIVNSATSDELIHITFSSEDNIDEAIRTGSEAFEEWRRTPPVERSQYLFDLKAELNNRVDEIAEPLTREYGKTLAEVRRRFFRSSAETVSNQ